MKQHLNCFLAVVLGLFAHKTGHAGTFSMAHFVEPGEFSVGVEPEMTFTSGAGVGINLKYTHGLGELSNLMVGIGSGDGHRKFRVGAAYIMDFFPDVEGQVGAGLGTQVFYYNMKKEPGQVEASLVPYVHKSFSIHGTNVEPFISMPVGMSFNSGNYESLWTLSMGSMFKKTEHLSFVTELGIAISNTESYFSGGIVYYP